MKNHLMTKIHIKDLVEEATKPRLSTQQVAGILNVHPDTVRTYIHKGYLEAIRFGGDFQIEPTSVLRLLRKGIPQ